MITAYDGPPDSGIPTSARLLIVGPAWTEGDIAPYRAAGSHILHLDHNASDPTGCAFLDVEKSYVPVSDTPTIAGWIRTRLAYLNKHGRTDEKPCIYLWIGNKPTVYRALANVGLLAGVDYCWWLANQTGTWPTSFPTHTVAIQYRGADQGDPYDLSAAHDHLLTWEG